MEKLRTKKTDTSSLVTATVLYTNIGEVEEEIPDHAKYISDSEGNKLAGTIFDTKLNEWNLARNMLM